MNLSLKCYLMFRSVWCEVGPVNKLYWYKIKKAIPKTNPSTEFTLIITKDLLLAFESELCHLLLCWLASVTKRDKSPTFCINGSVSCGTHAPIYLLCTLWMMEDVPPPPASSLCGGVSVCGVAGSDSLGLPLSTLSFAAAHVSVAPSADGASSLLWVTSGWGSSESVSCFFISVTKGKGKHWEAVVQKGKR